MAQILVENLDPVILEKLETIARQHGRSLQEELKHILQPSVRG
jgi:antitoxin FitA